MDIFDLFLFVLLIVVLVYFYLDRRFSYWERKNVPHIPAESWLFGNVKDLFLGKENSAIVFDKIYRKFGDEPYCGFYEFQYPVLMIRDPQLVQSVLVENFNSFNGNKLADAIHPQSNDFLALNPFVLKGERWKEVRSLVVSGLTSNKLRVLDDFVKPIIKNIKSYFDSNPNDIEAYELARMFTGEMVANYGWGIGDGFSPSSPIRKMFDMNSIIESDSSIFRYLPNFLLYWLRIKNFNPEFVNFFRNLTGQAIQAIESSKNNQSTFLQNLINVRDKLRQNGKDMPLTDISSHMSTFYLEAYETTARVFSLIIQYLMMYPDVQQKLREEINKTEEITADSISKLPYLEMVLSEVIRVFSVFPNFAKICTKKCKLGSLDIDVGTYIVIPAYSLHHDPKYFPDPETFNPENFSEENKSQRSKFSHIVFGHGPRQCPGMKYAMTNLKLFFYHLLKEYKILPPSDHVANTMEHDPKSAVFYLHKGELYVRFSRLK